MIINNKVISIMLTLMVITIVTFAATAASDDNTPSVRIYGEENAAYPTQSFSGASDFIYPNYVDAFDPGIIAKDSATFNPAYIENNYDGTEITVEGSNSDEKVYFRVFYEPEYGHAIDNKMDDFGSGTNSVNMPNGALVTETTYMLVDDNSDSGHSGLPKAGSARDPDGSVVTSFMLPTHSSSLFDGVLPGMDTGMVIDLSSASGTPQLTDGVIEVQRRPFNLEEGESVNFMDHRIEFIRPTTNQEIKLEISYIGNMNRVEDKEKEKVIFEDTKYYVDRLNNLHTSLDADWRFYFTVDSMTYYASPIDKYEISLIVGRRLAAGETFYVDGVRYDMPAIYVTDDDKFKYITFQSPLPKCEGQMWYGGPNIDERNQADKSHVTCQWLANLLQNKNVWVLPPFNEEHLMIDDIGLEKFDTGTPSVPDWEICMESGDIIDGAKSALEFSYISEDVEDRFDSSLAERHYVCDGPQEWDWWNVVTKPDRYTELILPNQETTSDTYEDTESVCMLDHAVIADGNEYLITTSYIAPNSEGNERHIFSKSSKEVHDIIDRVETIDTSRDDCYNGKPRMAFEFDAVDATDFFVNEDEPTLRIYGENDAVYPTQSYTGAVDFIYPEAVHPFDPGVIAKDSVTFNPAYIENDYKETEITVAGSDGDEKVFFRVFYEPGYGHAIDNLMDNAGSGTHPVSMLNGALVTETTYMLIDDNSGSGHSGLPKSGEPRDGDDNVVTEFMLPTHSTDVNDDLPGMNAGQVVELSAADNGADDSTITDGNIAVQIDVTLKEGQSVNFMDHKVEFIRPTTGSDINVKISYIGNMHEVEDREKTKLVDEDKKYYVDRLNNLHPAVTPDADWRFYFNVTSMTYAATPVDKYTATLIVGRELYAGETFYVDGVRYDMPAIYVTSNTADPDANNDLFKYITFQSPLPKCDGPIWADVNEDNQADKSHVTCQWLANIMPTHDVWVLPPLNEGHIMIDDIDLPKVVCPCDDDLIIVDDVAGNILGGVGELKFHYTAEDIEERFNSSLAERMYVEECNGQEWDWWSIFTKPYQYTELVLPDDEPNGNEYLVTTSYIAPNCAGEERHTKNCLNDCKNPEAHDIIDSVDDIDHLGDDPIDREDCYYGKPRMAFEFDADDGTGLFINAAEEVKRLEGDVNNDGFVDDGDALLIAKHTVGLVVLTGDDFDAADVNDDGIVDALDLLQIKKFIVGLISVLPGGLYIP